MLFGSLSLSTMLAYVSERNNKDGRELCLLLTGGSLCFSNSVALFVTIP